MTKDIENPAWADCLRQRVEALAQMPDRDRRHLEVVENIRSRTGLPLSVLELAYEIAQEEGIDPALALELLVCQVAVVELAEPSPTEEAHSLAPPEWVSPVGLPAEAVALEKRLRQTFRRLRSMLERHDDINDAIFAFAREPDVASFDYQPSTAL